MAQKPVATNLAANLAKATATSPEKPKPKASGKVEPKPAKEKKPGRFNLPPAPKPDPEFDAEILKLPVIEGSPCQVKGCPGRHSILQTRHEAKQLVRTYICRTCLNIPDIK